MKKFLLFLFISFACFLGKVQAQFACNAGFTTSFLSPNSVKFNPVLTTGLPSVSHTWVFGDGTANSVEISPTHTYLNGTYVAKHFIVAYTNPGTAVCRDSVFTTITVGQNTCGLTASFISSNVASNPLTRAFTNTSIGAAATDSIKWTFGDGSSSATYSPTHTYANYGVYNVCLRIIKRNPNGVLQTNCIREFCKPDTITSPTISCNVQAYFSGIGDTTVVPSTFQFTNLSPGILPTDSVRWTFGDGTPAVSGFGSINSTHVYTAAGTFNVCLRIARATPSGAVTCVREYCKQIRITLTPVCNLTASFNFGSTTPNPLVQNFTNTSTGAAATDSIRWTFGDGTSSNVYSPTHTYANYGVYNVCLRIIKRNNAGVLQTNCVREFCKLDTIAAPINICNIQAYFSFTGNTTTIPSTFQFTNLSAGVLPTDSIRWTFGDGTISTLANPSHTYTVAGTYNVCLRIARATISGTPCVREYCKLITITNPITCNLVASFNFFGAASSPLVQSFVNTSIGAAPSDSIRWTFGDGTSSNVYSPTHTYANYGVYNVCLRIIKRNNLGVLQTNCVSEKCRLDTIAAPISFCNIQAYFSYSATTSQPNSIQFTNQSTGVLNTDLLTWNFGDGSPLVVGNNTPTHIYTISGTYNVCIRIVRNTPGAVPCVREYCKLVTIVIPTACNLQANFTWYRDSLVTVPNSYHFTNTTLGLGATDSVRWSFGDGTFSNAVNPTHGYNQPGSYVVCLRVQKRNNSGTLSNCVSEKCYTITFAPLCNVVANYTRTISSTNFRTINFNNTSVVSGAGAIAQWTFGDGTSFTGWNATHTYAQAGSYYVCLRVQLGTCVSYKCDTVRVIAPVTPNCNNIIMSYSFVRDSLYQNRIRFTAVSNVPTLSQTWTITRLPITATSGNIIINQNNPTYAFLDSGNYRVCLSGTFAGGCIKEYCSTIHINYNTPTTSACNLQLFPNPASSTVNGTITLAQPLMLNAFVYNTLNMVVAQKQQQGAIGVNTVSVNIATLPAGLYLYRLYYGNQVCTATFMKQ